MRDSLGTNDIVDSTTMSKNANFGEFARLGFEIILAQNTYDVIVHIISVHSVDRLVHLGYDRSDKHGHISF